MLETKRTWGEVGGGLREERTDDPGIVSKSFRAAFFPSSLSLEKTRKKERERERRCAQSEVSKKYQEAEGRKGLNVDDESKLVGRSSPGGKITDRDEPSK